MSKSAEFAVLRDELERAKAAWTRGEIEIQQFAPHSDAFFDWCEENAAFLEEAARLKEALEDPPPSLLARLEKIIHANPESVWRVMGPEARAIVSAILKWSKERRA